MKYLVAFAISGIHQSPVLYRSRAPFNSILGETYQAVNENEGSKLYLEQTGHHPPTFNYSVVGPNNHFQLNGFGTIDAHLTTIKGERIGKNILTFDDGSLFTFTNFKTIKNIFRLNIKNIIFIKYFQEYLIKFYKN